MFKHIITLTFRSINRNKLFSVINLLGLTLSISACILIITWVHHERQFDKFHKKIENLYFISSQHLRSDGGSNIGINTPSNLAPLLKEKYNHFVRYSRIRFTDQTVYLKSTDFEMEGKGIMADSSFLGMFTYPLKWGGLDQALETPNSIVISESLSTKLFGDKNPVNQPLTVKVKQGEVQLNVSAVMEDVPAQSSLQFDFILSYEGELKRQPWLNKWGSYSVLSFVEVSDHSDPNSASSILVDEKIDDVKLIFTKYSKIHSYWPFNEPLEGFRQVSNKYILLFFLVALVIIIIACINYINLSAAQYYLKLKDFGIKKAIGSSRLNLFLTYITEPLFIVLSSLGIATLLVNLLFTQINRWIGLNIENIYLDGVLIILLGCILLILTLGLLTTPIFKLQSVNLLSATTGTYKVKPSNWGIKNKLVITQLSVSIIFIICSLFISRQVDFILKKDAGLNRENVIYFPLPRQLNGKFDLFRQTLKEDNSISSVTQTSELPISIENASTDPKWKNKSETDRTWLNFAWIDHEFLETFNIKLIDGRLFPNVRQESANYIINESARKYMGMENPIGEELTFWNGKGQIIGLVEDFHFRDFHHEIKPLIFMLGQDDCEFACIKTAPGKTIEAIETLQKTYNDLNISFPLEYHFLDERYENMYYQEIMIRKLSKSSTLLAILISCLGIFGLARLNSQRKIKEVAIRKVNGARIIEILTLLNSNLIKWVGIAFVIATPISWYAMDKWLENFAFKTELSWWVFVLAGLLAMGVALVTVSFQSWRAATRNPIEALRYE